MLPSVDEPKAQNAERQDSTDSNRLHPDPRQRQVPHAAATTEATDTAGKTTPTASTATENPATAGTPGPSSVADTVQAWDKMFSLMSSLSSPMAVAEAAHAAMITTATMLEFQSSRRSGSGDTEDSIKIATDIR